MLIFIPFCYRAMRFPISFFLDWIVDFIIGMEPNLASFPSQPTA